ncbi:MAG: DUF748 domain-containing protein, partial [Flavobacteriales bacterium]|nr:DUF748 domain-containing protein [Flavobacteriales bacterium]
MKRRYKIIAILLFVIVVARLSLPFLLKNYINTQLSTLEGYYGYVNDVDLKLLTGSYCLENFNIDEDNGQLKTPFISAEKVKLSIDWKSLLKGKVVGEINISNGRVNYVLQEQKDIRDSTDLKKWYELAQDMMPIQLNRVDITNAEIIYADHFKGDPFEVKMSNIDLLAENLSNVIHPDDTFPSQFALKGQIMGHGYIWTEGRMNVLKDTPDVQVDLRVEKVNITELNLIFQKYFGVDVYSGIFNNYSEFNMLDGKIDGYTK